ncbi:hypothetical protein [Bernardetia sp. MNP-M8]|uniref:hypothetical protein n=1 Tax=Bernardetia sp. MNP-M8 TaxID=3127470 RepID=UPI0030CFE321
MPKNYDQIIEQSHLNITALSKKIKELDKFQEKLDKSQKQITDLANQNIEIPLYFNNLFEEIMEISIQYTESLGKASEKYLDGNNKIFVNKITDFETRLAEFKEQIIRLSKADFNVLFEELQKEFISQSKKDLELEYKKIDVKTDAIAKTANSYLEKINTSLTEKTTAFEGKIQEFKIQISRLSDTDFNILFEGLQKEFILQTQKDLQVEYIKLATRTEDLQRVISNLSNQANRFEEIDFTKQFKEVHEKLANIHTSTNEISSSLEILSQKSNNIYQSVREIKNSVQENHELVLDRIKEQRESLRQQNEKLQEHFEPLNKKIEGLEKQNKMLESNLAINTILTGVGIVIVIGLLIFSVVK